MPNRLLAATLAALIACAGLFATQARAIDFTVNTTTNGSQSQTAVAGFATLGFIVVWNNSTASGIHGQRYNKNGVKIGSEFIVSNALALESAPAVATFSDGAFVVAWYAFNGPQGVYAQLFDKTGMKVGGLINVANDAPGLFGSTIDIAVNDNDDFVVAWESGDTPNIAAKRYNKAGQPKGSLIELTTGSKPANTPSIAALTNAGFVITWTVDAPTASKRVVWAQRLSAQGAKLGAAIKVPSTALTNRTAAHVAPLPNSGFVVAWGEYAGSRLNARVQRFNSNGSRNGGEVIANAGALTPPGGTFNAPQIVVTRSGRFVVAWDSGPSDAENIVGQRFLADGAKSGTNFILNTVKRGSQTSSSLAPAAGANGFVGAWEDYDGVDSNIAANIFTQ